MNTCKHYATTDIKTIVDKSYITKEQSETVVCIE